MGGAGAREHPFTEDSHARSGTIDRVTGGQTRHRRTAPHCATALATVDSATGERGAWCERRGANRARGRGTGAAAGHRPRAGRNPWMAPIRLSGSSGCATRWPSVRRTPAGSPNRRCAPVPRDPELLLLAALAAMAASQPERALALLKRYQKRFAPGKPITLLTALALAQQRQFRRAWTMLEAEGLEILSGRCPLVRGRRCDAGLAA